MRDSWQVNGVMAYCPHCGLAVQVDVAVVIDAGEEPEAAERARSGRLSRVTCRGCEQSFWPAVPFLYHEPARSLAVAYLPPAAEDPGAIVTALLARWCEATAATPADYLLNPLEANDPADFIAIVEAGGRPEGGEDDRWTETRVWLARLGERELLDALGTLVTAGDADELLRRLNDQPQLLDPALVAGIEHLAQRAEGEDREGVADLLRDAAALLRAHTPPDDQETPDDPEGLIRNALAGGDIEAALPFLERPDPERQEAVRRIFQGHHEVAEQREGFLDHARLFSGMVSDMLLSSTPEDLPSGLVPNAPELGDVEPEVIEAFLCASGIDTALDLIARYPELLGEQTREAIQEHAADAAEAGDDGRVTHLLMLLDCLTLADYETEGDES